MVEHVLGDDAIVSSGYGARACVLAGAVADTERRQDIRT